MNTVVADQAPRASHKPSHSNPVWKILPPLVLALVLLATAVSQFGLVALVLPMVFATPVIFVVLLLITVGK